MSSAWWPHSKWAMKSMPFAGEGALSGAPRSEQVVTDIAVSVAREPITMSKFLIEAANEIEKAHAVLDHAGVPRDDGVGCEYTLAARVHAALEERGDGDQGD